MILGAEIGLLVYGIIVLIRGRYSLGKGKTVTGSRELAGRYAARLVML